MLLIASGDNATELETKTNEALALISEWGRSVKLTFSPTKTQIIAFTPHAKNAQIEMDGVEIAFSPNIKVLGVVIDEHLKFTDHAKYAIMKATRVFKNLCKFVRPTWGVHAENITTIYRQVIEPIITYAAGVWGEAANIQYIRKSLRSFQRSFAIRAIRGFHTISAVSALALAQFTPLHLKVREVHAIETLKRSGTHDAIPSDIYLERPAKPHEKLHPSKRRRFVFGKVNSQEETNAIASPTNIYIDGSKIDGSVGASFVVYNADSVKITRKFKMNALCSVFQAELYAIDKALEWAKSHLNTDLTLYTDSLSSIHAIENTSNNHQLVVSIHAHLNYLSQTFNVRLAWIKAHAGIHGNEEADIAAKEATKLKKRIEYNNFPLSHAKYLIRQESQEEWAREYASAIQGSGTRHWLPTLDTVRSFSNAIENSFELTQVMTGHGFHKQYLNRFKICNNATCPCDNATEQSIEHLIKDCQRYASQRFKYISICSHHNATPYQMTEIMKNEELINAFNAYISSIIKSLKEFNTPTP